MAFWYLTISSFIGISPLAAHYYGRLRIGLQSADRYEVDLERPMTAKEIRDANKEEGWACYHPGDLTRGFPDQQSVIDAALVEFERIKSDGDVLFLGNCASADPKEPLAGPPALVAAARAIWEEWEAIDGWNDRLRAPALSKRWDSIEAA